MHYANPFRILVMLLICMGVALHGQVKITGLTIESKKNGAYLQIKTNKSFNIRDASGWIRQQNTFYLTLLNATVDSVALEQVSMIEPFRKFDFEKVGESVQLMFELADTVESFELYVAENPPELMVSLRFPLEDVLAELKIEKEELEPAPPLAASLATSGPGSTYGKVKTALYLTGASLTVAGVISQDNSDGLRWEFSTGLGLILGTYLFDKYIKPLFND